jgi:iron complex transport system ATP-binding protein
MTDSSSKTGSDLAIAGTDLGHFYQAGRWLFRHLDFSVRRGSVQAVIGLNGCGKTTLLRILVGLLKPTEGAVVRNGQTALVPQLFQTVFSFTALDMVLMGRARKIGLFARPSPQDEKAALAALDRLGALDLAPRPFAELSGGQRQLVILARALASEADILFLDEPASALDLGRQAHLIRWMRELSRVDGYTVVFTTHLPQQALAVADEVMIMGLDGGVKAGPAGDVLTEENLTRAYGTEVRKVEFERNGRKSEALVAVFPEDIDEERL